MKKRKLRTKIIISYVFLIFLFGVFLSSVNYILTLRLLEKQTAVGLNSVKTLAFVNNNLLDIYIKPLQENLILQKTRALAFKLSLALPGKDYKTSARNKQIASILGGEATGTESSATGSIIIINKEGIIIYNSGGGLAGKNYKVLKSKNPETYNLVRRSFKKKENYGYFKDSASSLGKSKNRYFAAVQIPKTNLLLFYVSKVTLSAHVRSLIKNAEQRELGVLTKELKNFYIGVAIIMGIFFPVILLAFTALSIFLGMKLASKISKPLVELQEGVEHISKGNFNVKVDQKHGTSEVLHLATAFNRLGTDLQSYIAKLEKEIEARNAIESEIKIAQSIQKSVLPRFTKDFMGNFFNLFAQLKPAKDIAGDFFDFFFLDKEKTKLVFLVADVSGKGVPAAFFMGIVKTLIKQIYLSDINKSPGQVLSEANNHLCGGNNELMFVTMFLVRYDLDTEYISYANAGHHEALVLRKNGKIERFGSTNNVVLGFVEGARYSSAQEYIHAGDRLILYTDGIIEAESDEGAYYGEEQLEKVILANSSLPLKEICKNVIKDVSLFQNDDLSDDVTLLIFEKNK